MGGHVSWDWSPAPLSFSCHTGMRGLLLGVGGRDAFPLLWSQAPRWGRGASLQGHLLAPGLEEQTQAGEPPGTDYQCLQSGKPWNPSSSESFLVPFPPEVPTCPNSHMAGPPEGATGHGLWSTFCFLQGPSGRPGPGRAHRGVGSQWAAGDANRCGLLAPAEGQEVRQPVVINNQAWPGPRGQRWTFAPAPDCDIPNPPKGPACSMTFGGEAQGQTGATLGFPCP